MNKSVIGIDIGGTSIVIGKFAGTEMIDKTSIDTQSKTDAKNILTRMYEAIRSLDINGIEAIGIGSPGYIDVEKGEIKLIYNIPSFQDLNLKEAVSKEFNLPVFLNNDANCFALGEYYFGETSKLSNVICIALGTGVGGGIIINGKIYSGLFGGAGEFGLIPYLNSNFENYCSGAFFQNFYETTGKTLFAKAEQGDRSAHKIFDIYGKHLGNLFTELMYTLAPEAIVIGGSVANGYKYFSPALKEKIDTFPVELVRNTIQIYTAKVSDAGLKGAAALCF